MPPDASNTRLVQVGAVVRVHRRMNAHVLDVVEVRHGASWTRAVRLSATAARRDATRLSLSRAAQGTRSRLILAPRQIDLHDEGARQLACHRHEYQNHALDEKLAKAFMVAAVAVVWWW